MRTCIKKSFVLVAALGSVPAGHASAQTLSILHSFALAPTSTVNVDGELPQSLVLSGHTLYGATGWGGTNGNGTIFKVNDDGSAFTTVHGFTGSDGAQPNSLVLSGRTLYGTTDGSGLSGAATVFKVSEDGSEFTVLQRFDGITILGSPNSLALSGSTLYGTTDLGIFALNTDGTGFRVVHRFTGWSIVTDTNSEGAYANSLVVSGSTLYGTAYYGGSSANGTVFKVNTNGTGFTTLHSFSQADPGNTNLRNSDGANPNTLIQSGSMLYGTASGGGTNGNGTLFKLSVDGTGFKVIYTFSAFDRWGGGCAFCAGNGDGVQPDSLVVSGGTLYGATHSGGTGGDGTIFEIGTDGTGFTNLCNFFLNVGGISPSDILLSGNKLYGAAAFFNGTLFSLALLPQLTITPSGSNSILTWPTNFTGYNLQSTSDLFSPVWTTNSTVPVVLNAQYTVTNRVSGTQQFFRLSQ
jgi:uncharacterized repeat protein (TIGR03803 family)